MDHGLTVGPIKGIENNLGEMVNKIALGGANAVLGHIGIPLYAHRGYGPDIGLILQQPLLGESVLVQIATAQWTLEWTSNYNHLNNYSI